MLPETANTTKDTASSCKYNDRSCRKLQVQRTMLLETVTMTISVVGNLVTTPTVLDRHALIDLSIDGADC